MDMDEILLTAEEQMEKALTYLKNELRGVRTGRASTGLVEFVKVECYGSMADLRSVALVSVPEPTQILVKPFDPSTLQSIIKGLQTAGLGLNPIAEGKQIRLNLPSLSGENRQKLIGSVKAMGEQAKVAVRNTRRDANKQIDTAAKDKSQALSEDDIEQAKNEVQELVKKYEQQAEELLASKTKEIQEI
jgi:ribosome recycling factor